MIPKFLIYIFYILKYKGYYDSGKKPLKRIQIIKKKKRKEMGDEFKNVKIFKAVDNISFECSPGKIFGLIGPNGAGKKLQLSE